MKDIIQLHDRRFKVMISAEEIDRAVEAVATRINADYSNCDTPIFLAVLNGSFMFLSDLIKKIDFNNEISFVKLASYEGTESTGAVKNLIGLNGSIEGRHIVIVEDIVDSGMTLSYLSKYLETRGAASIRIATLLDKPERRRVDLKADYSCFTIPDEFVVGYGLDYDEKYRNLPDIGVLDPRIYGAN